MKIDRHSDERRTLIDWGNGKTWKTCKTIHVHKAMALGAHYHKLKDERFMLVSGSGTMTLDGKISDFNSGEVVDVPAGMKHSFTLGSGSVLIGLCTKEFDETDDYR